MSIRGFVKGVFGLNKPPALQLGPLVNAIKDPATKEAVNYLGTVIQALIARLNQYEPAIKQALIVTDAAGEPVLRLGASPPSPYTLWARSAAIGGTDPSGATSPFTSDENGAITLSGAALNIRQIDLISDPGLTDNDPGAGEISWDAFDLRFAGNTYSIAAGDTANKFAYWSEGDTTLTGTDAFVPQLGDFLIFTNEAGTADEAYNKVANRAIVRENLLGGIITGYIPQPIASASLNVAGINTQLSVNVVNISGQAGAIYTVTVKTQVRCETFGGAVGTDGFFLNVTVDGVLTRIDAYEFIGGFSKFHTDTFFGRSDHEGLGDVANDSVSMSFYSAFLSSLNIDFVMNSQNSGVATFGTVEIYAAYAFEA